MKQILILAMILSLGCSKEDNFSPKEPERMSFDKLCLEIAHNIRNRDSNKRHEIIKKTEYYRNSFFPIDINSIIANSNNFQNGI